MPPAASIASVSPASSAPARRGGGQDVLAGDERRQVAPHPHPPGSRPSAGVELAARHRERIGVGEHDRRGAPDLLLGVEPRWARPSATVRTTRTSWSTPLGPGGPDHLGHAEGAVGRRQ